MGFGSGGFGGSGGSGGGGGDSLWSEYGDNTVRPDAPATSVTLIENDGNSRDAPKAVVIVRNEGLDDNAEFAMGNPYVAGVGLNALGCYSRNDDDPTWRLNFSWEESGTFASVLDGVERSAFESFGEHGQFKPWMRVEMSGRGINFGSSVRAAPTEVTRTANVVTVGPTENPHRMAVGDALWKTQDPYDGEASDLALFGPDSGDDPDFTIASVVDPYIFTYADAGDDGTSAGGILFSKETDVTFGRDATNIAAVRVNGSSVAQFTSNGIVVPDLGVYGSTILNLGAEGVASTDVDADQLHVKEGKTFYNQGTYRSTGWFNSGSEVQTTQEVFLVGTGDGHKTTGLGVIGGVDWKRVMIKNVGQGSANDLQIVPGGADTIDSAINLTIPADSAVTLVSQGTNWHVFYHPAPP